MTYLEDRGERSAVVISEGEQMSRPGVGRAVALGSQTREEFGLFRSEMAEGERGGGALPPDLLRVLLPPLGAGRAVER